MSTDYDTFEVSTEKYISFACLIEEEKEYLIESILRFPFYETCDVQRNSFSLCQLLGLFFFLNRLPRLKRIYLSKTRGWEEERALQSLFHSIHELPIQFVDLSHCDFSDDFVEVLISAINNSRTITKVDFSGLCFTDRAIEKLCENEKLLECKFSGLCFSNSRRIDASLQRNRQKVLDEHDFLGDMVHYDSTPEAATNALKIDADIWRKRLILSKIQTTSIGNYLRQEKHSILETHLSVTQRFHYLREKSMKERIEVEDLERKAEEYQNELAEMQHDPAEIHKYKELLRESERSRLELECQLNVAVQLRQMAENTFNDLSEKWGRLSKEVHFSLDGPSTNSLDS